MYEVQDGRIVMPNVTDCKYGWDYDREISNEGALSHAASIVTDVSLYFILLRKKVCFLRICDRNKNIDVSSTSWNIQGGKKNHDVVDVNFW